MWMIGRREIVKEETAHIRVMVGLFDGQKGGCRNREKVKQKKVGK